MFILTTITFHHQESENKLPNLSRRQYELFCSRATIRIKFKVKSVE